MRGLFLLIALAATALLGSGCATTDEQNVSSIPWNRPEKWEGQGPLGGFAPNSY